MRESNFAFPAQNRASVCISSQLYDRRALDTNSSLPLFNSLTHLVYLTSTSPRIREIMTMDGGLERLVRILHDFCLSPPPPDNPAIFYGLSPPGSHPTKPAPTLLPKTYDKHAAYRFSLAFQCIVNIGVRGSEPIRSRVVQAGTLEVVGCILEAWLASKGFAVGPSVAANGMPRETREQRMARRQAQSEMRQRQQAAELARALERQIAASDRRTIRPGDTSLQSADTSQEEPMQTEQATPSASRAQDTDTSADTSTNATPNGSNTPTGAVVVPGRDRSGTIIARPVWDQPTATIRRPHRSRLAVPDASAGPSTSTSAANSRPETETEDDGDVDMDTSRDGDAPSPSPERQTDNGTIRATHSRRAVGIVTDATAPAANAGLDMPSDAHIIINDDGVTGVGVEDGIVSLETNDDFAMGAPPGAPGALEGPPPPRTVADGHAGPGERTPRAGTTNLPMTAARTPNMGNFLTPTADAGRVGGGDTPARQNTIRAGNATGNNGTPSHHHHHHHARDIDAGPYRDEDVLLSLQLLAYLSKYPHCRQAFYKPRTSFHPATAQISNEGRFGQPSSSSRSAAAASSSSVASTGSGRDVHPLVKAFNNATGRGKEKERASPSSTAATAGGSSSSPAGPTTNGAATPRMTNVFALVERFTYRHSSSELESSNPPPSLPPEIQYWAGVIMRNACRKDDSRGGIRQCANMLCGRWERFPREFAKCRRCRKAKYCGKECQSTAWSEGHRFWCSAKDPEDDGEHHHHGESSRAGANAGVAGAGGAATRADRAERREARERERERDRERERERQARAVAAEGRLAEEGGGATGTTLPQPSTVRITASGTSTATAVPPRLAPAPAQAQAPIGTAASPSRNPVLAAGLDVSGTWTYRPGNAVPPAAWPAEDVADINADLRRRFLARQPASATERDGEEVEMAGPSRVRGNEEGGDDVDMVVD
ncbi:hypothetical protein K466DRAFT_527585 [Polyporus arcularius HHB13444]|uniref:MYND-type domain-containing protein n=1 Tax=Polyporus arcularius HHB13444 TaxID=1314778 RepID=A0A5C3P7R6_9APHY|nr:hypothetical protein K466DRAFT_527585 [Polyporus arcularius HHB13444]